jgi:hypothetical protein
VAPFSRSRRFAAGRSGHGSANGFADRDRITPYLRSLLLLRIEMSHEAIRADQKASGADLNEHVGDDL